MDEATPTRALNGTRIIISGKNLPAALHLRDRAKSMRGSYGKPHQTTDFTSIRLCYARTNHISRKE